MVLLLIEWRFTTTVGSMAALQHCIAEKFFAQLDESKKIEPHILDQLRLLLQEGGKPKVDSLVKIFTSLPDEEVK